MNVDNKARSRCYAVRNAAIVREAQIQMIGAADKYDDVSAQSNTTWRKERFWYQYHSNGFGRNVDSTLCSDKPLLCEFCNYSGKRRGG